MTILFDTHLHGYLTGPNDVTFAQYAGLVAQRRAAGNALFLGAGDDLGPSQMSAVFQGAQMIEAFHVAGLDADTHGNHEFDYGPDNLVEQVRASRFAWVSANVLDRRTGDMFAAEAGARPFVIKEAGDGDRYETLTTAAVLIAGEAGPLLIDLLAEAVMRTGTIAPQEEGRILIGRE